jgi:DNA-directed RNA polymerase beta' subunit
MTDLRIPDAKQELLDAAQKQVNRVEKNYDRGIITGASGTTSCSTSGRTAVRR